MVTAVVAICLVVLLFIAIFCFIAGWRTGTVKLKKEIAEGEVRKAADKRFYEVEKAKIKNEVFENAKNTKNKMSGYNNDRDKFNAVNNSLRDKH